MICSGPVLPLSRSPEGLAIQSTVKGCNVANINVSYQELNSNADRLLAGRDEINATLSKLQAQIASLTQAGFQTDRSSGAYNEAYNRFTSGAQNTIGGLNDLAQFLRTTAQTLGDVDQQLASRLGR